MFERDFKRVYLGRFIITIHPCEHMEEDKRGISEDSLARHGDLPGVPATKEAEAGMLLLDPRSSRPAHPPNHNNNNILLLF